MRVESPKDDTNYWVWFIILAWALGMGIWIFCDSQDSHLYQDEDRYYDIPPHEAYPI